MAKYTQSTAKYSQIQPKYTQDTAKYSHIKSAKVPKLAKYGEPIKGSGQNCLKRVFQRVFPEVFQRCPRGVQTVNTVARPLNTGHKTMDTARNTVFPGYGIKTLAGPRVCDTEPG